MASVKLGATVSDIRGSIGGTTFSRNGGGAYAKARTCGTNPNSVAQQVVRAIMSACYTAWSLLATEVRDAWATYASNITIPNRLGDQINLSGYNMFCRTKSICDLIGVATPAAAPTVMALADQDASIEVAASASTQVVTVTYDATKDWAGEVGGHLLCYQGKPQNATINSYNGPFKYAGKVDGAETPPSGSYAMPSIHTIGAGQKVFMQFRVLRADGRLSSPFCFTGDCGV